MALNFLQLVQRAWAESGLGNIGPQGVETQTGRHADFVRWVQTAYEEIQNLRDWNTNWARSVFALVPAKSEYDPVTDFGITGGVKHWLREGCFVSRAGDPMPFWLTYIEWERFRVMPTQLQAEGIPTVFSVRPDGVVCYYPRPGEALSVSHEYQRQPEELTSPTQVPRWKKRHEMAIVWKAVMLYANFNKDWSLEAKAKDAYEDVMDAVYTSEAPEITHAGPLA